MYSWWPWVEVRAGTVTAVPRGLLGARGEAAADAKPLRLGMHRALARQAKAAVAELGAAMASTQLVVAVAGLAVLAKAPCLWAVVEVVELVSSQISLGLRLITQVVGVGVATNARALGGLGEEARVGLTPCPLARPLSMGPRVLRILEEEVEVEAGALGKLAVPEDLVWLLFLTQPLRPPGSPFRAAL